jgi:hypothetical protein
MKKLNKKLSYTIYILLAVAFTSCDTIKAERDYNKRSWEINKMRLDLDYLKDLHEYKKDIEFKEKIAGIDSLISNYR